ncbi:hypothetical protein Tco_1327010 [Tanacetum coccineum]
MIEILGKLEGFISLFLKNVFMLNNQTLKDPRHGGRMMKIIGSRHIPKVPQNQAWFKPLSEEDRPATPEPAWSIPSSSLHVPINNWASALASSYESPAENSLLSQTGDIGVFIDWFCKKQEITELTPTPWKSCQFKIQTEFFFNKDLEYLRFGHKGDRLVLSITKMKAASYPDDGLEQMVPDQMWAEEEYIPPKPLPPKDKKILSTAVNLWIRNLVIKKRVEDFQLGIESYQTQLNLTKPRWEATGLEFMHDYKILDSPRAVVFRETYGMQMIMRFNEIHKFSDETLQQIDEALDYRVKEFKVNKINPGLNTRFWTTNECDQEPAFSLLFKSRLKLRQIFWNLKALFGGPFKLRWRWRYLVSVESIPNPMLTLTVANQRYHDN